MPLKNAISIRFYEELNDFLPEKKRKITYEIPCTGKNTIKNIIEAEGVPHVEVDLILANGQSVNFDYHARPGDHFSVYPEFESLDISPVTRLRPEPLRTTMFIVDANLGRLVRYLRMLGLDTKFDIYMDDPAIIHVAEIEKRIILTRDLGILKNGRVKRGYFIREQDPEKQIMEVVERFHLKSTFKPFTRCIACNGNIRPINKERVLHRVKEETRKCFDHFFICDQCEKVYWRGSHYERMLKKIRKLAD